MSSALGEITAANTTHCVCECMHMGVFVVSVNGHMSVFFSSGKVIDICFVGLREQTLEGVRTCRESVCEICAFVDSFWRIKQED